MKTFGNIYMDFSLTNEKTLLGTCNIIEDYEATPNKSDWKYAFNTQCFPDEEVLINDLEDVEKYDLATAVKKGNYSLHKEKLNRKICKLKIEF